MQMRGCVDALIIIFKEFEGLTSGSKLKTNNLENGLFRKSN